MLTANRPHAYGPGCDRETSGSGRWRKPKAKDAAPATEEGGRALVALAALCAASTATDGEYEEVSLEGGGYKRRRVGLRDSPSPPPAPARTSSAAKRAKTKSGGGGGGGGGTSSSANGSGSGSDSGAKVRRSNAINSHTHKASRPHKASENILIGVLKHVGARLAYGCESTDEGEEEAGAPGAMEGEEVIITSYNQYVSLKGAGRHATIVGPEWHAYKAKHAGKIPPNWQEKRKLEQVARKAAAGARKVAVGASAKSTSIAEAEVIIASYNQYVSLKGAGRHATIVGPEWHAYKAKHAGKMPPNWREKRKLEQVAREAAARARKAAVGASAKSTSIAEAEVIITSYNQYVSLKGAGRHATIVGPEWHAYKAKHADMIAEAKGKTKGKTTAATKSAKATEAAKPARLRHPNRDATDTNSAASALRCVASASMLSHEASAFTLDRRLIDEIKHAATGYTGVTRQGSRYNASIWRGRENACSTEYIGTFDTDLEAALAYNERAKELGKPLNVINASAKEIVQAKRNTARAGMYTVVQANNTTGYTGVTAFGSRFQVTLRQGTSAKGRSEHLGTFDTALEGAIAYNKRAEELGRPVNKLNATAEDIASAKRNMVQASMYATPLATSGYRGVVKQPSGRFKALIQGLNGRGEYLGTFDTDLEAALAYNKRARELGKAVNKVGALSSGSGSGNGNAGASGALKATKAMKATGATGASGKCEARTGAH